MNAPEGRTHMKFSGKVIKGLGIAKKLGFPTLNIHPRRVPKNFRHGVYAALVKTPAGKFPGALHYGPRHFHDAPKSFEVHCIGLKKSLEGKRIEITIGKRLRAVKKFKTEAALIKAISSDVRKANAILNKGL